MAKVKDVFVGARFDMLTVTEVGPPAHKRVAQVKCDCGVEKAIRVTHLGSCKSSSCGCQRVRHGHRRERESRTTRTWRSMIERCHNPARNSFASYGARGTSVCDRWRGQDGFARFLADMGERPEGMTLDRIDNDRGYEPGNCRWATTAEQTRNRRATKLNPELVREIVAGKFRSMSNAATAMEIGVAESCIDKVRRGDRWADVVAACRAEVGADP